MKHAPRVLRYLIPYWQLAVASVVLTILSAGVALLTGSKNALKGVGFFLGSLLLSLIGFQASVWMLAALVATGLVVAASMMRGGLGTPNKKAKFSQMLSRDKAINMLPVARLFLFGARDVWFVVAVPVFLSSVLGWKFWQAGDQSFAAQPGDTMTVFAAVFSPARFDDTVYIRWQRHDARTGWQESDRIPINITGGREGGFRGFTTKQNYTPGDWRVTLETRDGREISRLYITVTPVAADPARVLASERY